MRRKQVKTVRPSFRDCRQGGKLRAGRPGLAIDLPHEPVQPRKELVECLGKPEPVVFVFNH